MNIIVVLSVLLGVGCAAGGGPIVGLGNQRGVFYGVEAGGGLMIAQAAIAVQRDERATTVSLRADAVLDAAGLANGRDPAILPGLRLGGGYAVSGHEGRVFAVGANVNFLLRPNGVGGGCGDWVPAGLIGIDARYLGGEWQLVLAPRIEGHKGICNH